MKKFYVFFLMLIIIFSQACKKDPCKDLKCANGVCNDGICICQAGWETDATGACTVKQLCYNKDCVNGACNEVDGTCIVTQVGKKMLAVNVQYKTYATTKTV